MTEGFRCDIMIVITNYESEVIMMTIKVAEGTALRTSIDSFVGSIGEQLAEFLEVLTEEYNEEPSIEQYSELCKNIKIEVSPNISSISKHKENKIGFL